MHKQAHFKTARVVFRTISWLFHMRAAPSVMHSYISCRVSDWSWSGTPVSEIKGCHVCSTGWPDMLISTSSPAISLTPIRVIREFEL
jgi:hypothetical protein